MKLIVITGGVISGLGKGIIASSICLLLKNQGYKISPIKIDPYLNIDAGTMRPTEHGETWVTYDGFETDMDIGNYERFTQIEIPKTNSITSGQVYLETIKKERNLEFQGKCVQVTPHIPNEVKLRIKNILKNNKSDFGVIEIGGTVGDYENILFLDAMRQLKLEKNEIIFVHVVYLPIPNNLGEMKTKPAQHSVKELNSLGIQPDFIIARSTKPLDNIRKEKLSLFCNIAKENIISSYDVENIYEIPLLLEKNLIKNILNKFKLKYIKNKNKDWEMFIKNIKKIKKDIKIGIIGKYFDIGDFTLKDSYTSVIEAIKHASWNNNVNPIIEWIDSKELENYSKTNKLLQYNGLIVPGGFGKSGIEGKINAIKFARENNIPYLGLCYGMQLAVIEYARNVCNLKNANSSEINPKSKHKVVHIIEKQKEFLKNKNYGATMRLGNYKAILKNNTIVKKLYNKSKIIERHRHRYEINIKYINILEKKGLIFSGKSENKLLMEFIELKNHPFFVATQAHPEFKSYPLKPAPLFNGFIKASIKNINIGNIKK
jgi:CTP synthase